MVMNYANILAEELECKYEAYELVWLVSSENVGEVAKLL